MKKYLIGAGVVGALIIGAVATSGPSDDERFIARLRPMKAASTSLAKRTPSRGPTDLRQARRRVQRRSGHHGLYNLRRHERLQGRVRRGHERLRVLRQVRQSDPLTEAQRALQAWTPTSGHPHMKKTHHRRPAGWRHRRLPAGGRVGQRHRPRCTRSAWTSSQATTPITGRQLWLAATTNCALRRLPAPVDDLIDIERGHGARGAPAT